MSNENKEQLGMVTGDGLGRAAILLLTARSNVSVPFSDDDVMKAIGDLAEALHLRMSVQIAAFAYVTTWRKRAK